MEKSRRDQIKILMETFKKEDLEYTEEILKDSYKVEIDRKDKILSSMTVVTAPITILFAGVAFLSNNSLENNQRYLTYDPDLLVVMFYLVILFLIYFILSIIHNFHKLLGGENYNYLPYADNLLEMISNNKDYCIDNNIWADGEVIRYSRIDIIMQLAECSTKNAISNDVRLKYRQRTFRSTMLAIICAALGFLVASVHREQPDTWHVSDLWKKIDGSPSATVQQPASGSSTAPIQTTPSTQQYATPSPATSPNQGSK